MLRRSPRSDFVGGAFVFPGGALEPADGSDEARALVDELDDEAASERLGVDSGGLAYWVAAVRESFEEAGLLFARRGRDGTTVSFATPAEGARFAGHRAALNEHRASFLDVLEQEDLRLAFGRVHYVAHWITPEVSPRRYDTRFFVTEAPAGQTSAHDAHEVVSDVWVRPLEGLARHRAGDMEMMFPTVRTLEDIARHPTVSSLLAAAARTKEVPAILPQAVRDGDTARFLVPGDAGYGEPSPEAVDVATFDALARGRGLRDGAQS